MGRNRRKAEWSDGADYFALSIDTPNKADNIRSCEASVRAIFRSIQALSAE
jgi:hypothetical protein